MRAVQQLMSAIHAVFIYLVLFCGLFLVGLRFAPHFREGIGRMLVESSSFTTAFGLLFIVLALTLFVVYYILYNQKFITIKMSPYCAQADLALIADCLVNFWRIKHGGKEALFEVAMTRPGTLEIMARLPFIIDEAALSSLEVDVARILAKNFGYHKSFLLSLLS